MDDKQLIFKNKGAYYTISQKDKPPIVVTHTIGGQVVFTRTEFSARIGVHASTLRTWEKKGMLVPAFEREDGIKFYTEEQAMQYFKAHRKGKHDNRRI